jgi:flagellar biosynthetic protein FliR
LQQIVIHALLAATRLGAAMTFAPFFGSAAIPMRVKAGFALALTILLYPGYASQTLPAGMVSWVSAIAGELVIGLVIGLTMTLVFEGIQLAGQILGFQLGFSLANIIDPQSMVETPVLSNFHQMVGLYIFLQLGVHHWTLRALARSFSYLPMGEVVLSLPTVAGLARFSSGMLLIAVQIAAPVLLATLLADLALGMIGRASPQLPVLFVGLSVKSILGYCVLLAAVAFWPSVLEGHFARAIISAEQFLRLAG